ncbi:MAG: SGNH/GDSL hydrolase family protein [Burkholderiales bacterium]|nr:SGNH/GDSL hydrolase family protein [Burkholderiales bacterium]
MRLTSLRLAAVALAAAISSAPASAALQTLSGLYVFGDSLSDGGNYNGPGGPQAFPPPPYANSRYSNGPTAVEYLWNAYNPGNPGGFAPSNFGGTNYALGGATTGTGNYNSVNPGIPGPLQPFLHPYFASQGGIANQVAQFAGSCSACFNPATSLFVVWGFPNDVFLNPGLVATNPGALISAGVTNIQSAILALAAEGAAHFLVPNMPDLGNTPAFPGNAGLTALTQAFNFNLGLMLTALDNALTGVEIVQFDAYAANNAVIANPGAYGLTNVTDQCVQNLAPGPNQCDPDTWLFWDGVHPTTAGHRILGAQFAAAVPEPGTLVLVGAALLLVGMRRRAA